MLQQRVESGISTWEHAGAKSLAEMVSSFFRRHIGAFLPLPESHTKSFSTFGRSKPQFHRPHS
jgi:hypothetical protein